jgi:hypothetical protein
MAYRTIRILDFIYSSTVAYKIELGNEYARIFYGDSVVDTIDTPYLTAHLFELRYRQIGDVVWIVHKNYAPRKLSRTGETTFTLEAIEFKGGPFLVRNDINDPNSPATLACTATGVGAGGTLTSSSNIFLPGHVGTLFSLVHPRTTTIISQTGTNTSGIMLVKGTWSFNTHGTWTGTIKLQRQDNGSDWEDFRTYIGTGDRNIQLSGTEEGDNVSYRITSTASGANFDMNVNNANQTGIVRVTAFINTYNVACQVVTALASTSATKRWSEGAWSDSRGWPSGFAFFEDRAIYGGASLPLSDNEFSTSQYPSIRI